MKNITRHLLFCPVCGQKLEFSPINNSKVCFTHGDFMIRHIQGIKILEFVPTSWLEDREN